MTVFVIFALLALGMVVGPVLALRPSPRQQQIARLRANAIGHGLAVHIVDVQRAAVEYRLPWTMPDLERVGARRFPCFERQDARWIGAIGNRPVDNAALLPLVQRLPASVTIAAGSGDGFHVVWTERGYERDVAEIAAVLRAMRAAWLENP